MLLLSFIGDLIRLKQLNASMYPSFITLNWIIPQVTGPTIEQSVLEYVFLAAQTQQPSS